MAERASLTDRRQRERRGRLSEWLAVAVMSARGYRILARRARTPAGEIDLIACRGRRLAFVEVKRRETDEAAEAALGDRQRHRVRRAALLWIGRNPGFSEYDQGFDLVLIVPRRWPRYIRDGL